MSDSNDPFRYFQFRLEFDGIEQAGFSEATIGNFSIDPIEYREGGELSPAARKLPGMSKYGNITLKRGLTHSREIANWFQHVIDDSTPPTIDRRNVVIRVRNEAGLEIVAFEVVNAWPCKYETSDLNATGNEVAIDSIELCNEGIRRILSANG